MIYMYVQCNNMPTYALKIFKWNWWLKKFFKNFFLPQSHQEPCIPIPSPCPVSATPSQFHAVTLWNRRAVKSREGHQGLPHSQTGKCTLTSQVLPSPPGWLVPLFHPLVLLLPWCPGAHQEWLLPRWKIETLFVSCSQSSRLLSFPAWSALWSTHSPPTKS